MPDNKVKHLHLKADGAEDLDIISGAVQDSILRVEGIIYDSKKRNITLGLQRFRHENDKPSRIVSALRFDSVLSLKSIGVDRSNKDAFLVLLTAKFEETDTPAGVVTLNFAGNGTLIANVECLDVMLLDSGESWSTKSIPKHSD